MQFEDKEIPSSFICPISQCIMVHPVMTRTGHNYERKAILTWLKERNNTCPMTRNTLTVRDVVSNRALQFVIEAWCFSNKVQLESTSSADEDDEEILLTCSVSDYQATKQLPSTKTLPKNVHDAIIDRAWRKRAEIRNIPHYQSSVASRR